MIGELFEFGHIHTKKYNGVARKSNTLDQYLNVLFPENEIVYESDIPANVIKSRGCSVVRRYRVFARIESKNLLIDWKDVNHYRSLKVMIEDSRREVYFKELGYKYIRIPYFVQLSSEAIQYYFNEHVSEGCTSPSGFYGYPFEDSPGSFCSKGWNLFMEELKDLPRKIQYEIITSLKTVSSIFALPEEPDRYRVDEMVRDDMNASSRLRKKHESDMDNKLSKFLDSSVLTDAEYAQEAIYRYFIRVLHALKSELVTYPGYTWDMYMDIDIHGIEYVTFIIVTTTGTHKWSFRQHIYNIDEILKDYNSMHFYARGLLLQIRTNVPDNLIM